MGLQVREKSTGNNSTSLNEKKCAKIIFEIIFMLKCNKKSSSQLLCVLFSCRKELREHLKRQMAEKCAELKMHLTNKVKEADFMREVDRSDLSREKERRVQHRKAMMVFRDENKRVQTHMCSPLMLFR